MNQSERELKAYATLRKKVLNRLKGELYKIVGKNEKTSRMEYTSPGGNPL